MEKYQISKMAKVLGIAPETLRYYEKKQIISPQKDMGNSYRSFSMNDLCMLSKVRSFMKYGYSLEEANQLVHSENIEETRGMLLNKAYQLEKEIYEKLEAMHHLYDRVNRIQTTEKRLNHFDVVERTSIYTLKLFDESFELSEHPDLASNWINKTYTYPYSIVPMEKFIANSHESSEMGQSVEKRDVQPDLVMNDRVKELKPCKCLVTSRFLFENDIPNFLHEINDYCKNNCYVINGDIFIRTIATFTQNEGMMYLSEYWIPIE